MLRKTRARTNVCAPSCNVLSATHPTPFRPRQSTIHPEALVAAVYRPERSSGREVKRYLSRSIVTYDESRSPNLAPPQGPISAEPNVREVPRLRVNQTGIRTLAPFKCERGLTTCHSVRRDARVRWESGRPRCCKNLGDNQPEHGFRARVSHRTTSDPNLL